MSKPSFAVLLMIGLVSSFLPTSEIVAQKFPAYRGRMAGPPMPATSVYSLVDPRPTLLGYARIEVHCPSGATIKINRGIYEDSRKSIHRVFRTPIYDPAPRWYSIRLKDGDKWLKPSYVVRTPTRKPRDGDSVDTISLEAGEILHVVFSEERAIEAPTGALLPIESEKPEVTSPEKAATKEEATTEEAITSENAPTSKATAAKDAAARKAAAAKEAAAEKAAARKAAAGG